LFELNFLALDELGLPHHGLFGVFVLLLKSLVGKHGYENFLYEFLVVPDHRQVLADITEFLLERLLREEVEQELVVEDGPLFLVFDVLGGQHYVSEHLKGLDPLPLVFGERLDLVNHQGNVIKVSLLLRDLSEGHHLLKFLAIESRQVILYVLGYRALQATYKLFVRFQPNVHVVNEEELVREEEIRDDDFHDALELLN